MRKHRHLNTIEIDEIARYYVSGATPARTARRQCVVADGRILALNDARAASHAMRALPSVSIRLVDKAFQSKRAERGGTCDVQSASITIKTYLMEVNVSNSRHLNNHSLCPGPTQICENLLMVQPPRVSGE